MDKEKCFYCGKHIEIYIEIIENEPVCKICIDDLSTEQQEQKAKEL